MTEIEKEKAVLAEVTVRAWQDMVYRKKLADDPAQVLREAGVILPAGCRVTLLENTGSIAHLAIPRLEDLTGSGKERFLSELAGLIPSPAGLELRLHQNTDDEFFLVIPQPPQPVEPLSDEELTKVCGGGGGGGTFGGGISGIFGGIGNSGNSGGGDLYGSFGGGGIGGHEGHGGQNPTIIS